MSPSPSRRAVLGGLGLGLAACPFSLGLARAETAPQASALTAAPQAGASFGL
ncbi:hypothetical protein [Rhodobacter capsulatus]|uniref:hypothetical protein n=1 Tax=Rhodobacter capsulatus TaxID=1061 RepID=UPI004024F61C